MEVVGELRPTLTPTKILWRTAQLVWRDLRRSGCVAVRGARAYVVAAFDGVLYPSRVRIYICITTRTPASIPAFKLWKTT